MGTPMEKSIFRIREIYDVPGYKHAELIIDRLESKIDPIKEQYLEIRTIHIIIEKALE